MFECGTCGKGFPAGWRARDNHCRATGHDWPDFECDKCDACFRNERARWNHMVNMGHLGDNTEVWECEQCYHQEPTEAAIKDHEVEEHFWCRDCQRIFQNHNNIKMHLNSRIHRGQDIDCPFCRTCFTTATGMVHHLENGACRNAPGLTRDDIYRIVRRKDPNGIISKKLIGWEGESGAQYEASDRAWNGHAWECYFCHRGFRTLNSLNQHLNSPAHRQALYHCLNRNCGTDFKTLAAIINHLESESCGAMRFETVQRRIGDIVSGNRLIKF